MRAAVHSIDHFALTVPDLHKALHFYEAFGLDVDVALDAQQLRASGSDHVWGRIVPGDRKCLAYLSLNCFAEDYAEIRDRFAGAGTIVGEPHPRHRHADGFWANDPDGNLLQVRVGPKTTPNEPSKNLPLPRVDALRGAYVRATVAKVRPTRLSHVLLFTADVDRQIAFYTQMLGLGLSDRSRDIIAFMHGRHGSDHHLVAFAKSNARGWHHASWDVASVEDVGLGWTQMQEAGYSRAWGPGRHVLGSNYFCYVEDPWGSFFEYSAGIDHVAAGFEWPAGDFAPEDALYLWGPPPPSNFVINSEATTS